MKNTLLILFLIGFTVICVTGCERPMAKPMMDAVAPTEMPTKDDPEAFTVALVQAAVDLYKTGSHEAIATHYNDPASIDGQWYVFITDENDLFVAHPAAPSFVGRDIKDIVAIDGSLAGVEIAMATEEGQWSSYLWPNPETNKVEQKRTWAIRLDGYLFGSGYYAPWSPDPATLLTDVSKDDPAAFTRAVVLAAIARYESEGLEAIATHYNDPASIDGQWYVFITDASDMFVAHAPRPDFIGTDLKDVVGLDGSSLGADIAKATGIGLWIEYLWPNPETGKNEQKRTWSIRHDGYLFGSGHYEPAMTDEPAAEAAASEAN